MIVRTSIVLVVTGTLFTVVGLFAPAANLGVGATPASLFQIVGGLLDWKLDGPALPVGLKAIEARLLGGSAVLVLMALLAIGLALFKFLRASLIPCVVMTVAAGFLMFTMAGIRDVAVAVPQSYGWILLIAGSLVAAVTGVFTLFGPGPEEIARRSALTKERGSLAIWRTRSEPVPAPPPQPEAPQPKPAKPKPARLAADEAKPVSPKADPANLDRPTPPRPRAAEAPPGAGLPEVEPDTLGSMATSGYSGEEPTESGGWVLSGFDAKGMAVRLNISDVDLRTTDGGILIGRNAKQCRLVLNDDSVSRRHARLAGGNPLTIEDLDSANGTVVNREILAPGQKVPIEPGVAIEIGAVRLTLVRS
jgi:hypothetical protein